MSASSQSYPQARVRLSPLTITEVVVPGEPARVRRLGKSRIYYFAAAGAISGILAGVAAATNAWIPAWIGSETGNSGVSAAVVAALPRGPRDFGSARAITSGLTGRLVTEWRDRPSYRLLIEPSDPAQQQEFALAVTDSPRPLSVALQLVDASGNALCGQDVVVRFDAERAALNAAGANGASAGPAPAPAALEQVKAQESARENGREIFDNQIGDDGQITGLNAQGQMPCSLQAYETAASWNLSPDFPSIAEQAELLRAQTESTAQKTAPAHKPETDKKPEVHKLTASLDGFLLPKAAVR